MAAGSVMDALGSEEPGAASSRLPSDKTSFVGREREVEHVRRLLADTRLLTLTGPGGVGKTRLATEAARRSSLRFVGGIFVVELAGLRDPGLVMATIGAAVGLGAAEGAPPVEALAARLGDSETLLMLDNFEHLVRAAPLVQSLLGATATLRVIVTSRVPLHLAGEQEYRVAPLQLADPRMLVDVDAVGRVGSIALFVDRARGVRPDFELTAGNVRAVAGICRILDGLPLAIELAAARTKVLPPAGLLARLEARVPALAVGPVDAPERQRTVEATIDCSYELLGPSDRQAFADLGVFIGGFSLGGAQEVLGPDAGPGFDALEMLGRLVDHSLVGLGDSRFEERWPLPVKHPMLPAWRPRWAISADWP